jgi:hypothetical protein
MARAVSKKVAAWMSIGADYPRAMTSFPADILLCFTQSGGQDRAEPVHTSAEPEQPAPDPIFVVAINDSFCATLFLAE